MSTKPTVSVTYAPVPTYRLVAIARDNVKCGEQPAFFAETIEKTCKVAGESCAGAPVAVYRRCEMDAEGNPVEFDITSGCPVTPDFTLDNAGDDDAGVAICDAGGEPRAVHAVHLGPYEAMMETYGAMMAFAEENGDELDSPSYEIYVNDPYSVKPEEIRTEIYVPVKAKK